MKICFTNDVGTIIFGKGGRFNIIEIDGPALPPKNRTVTSYYGIDGQRCISETSGARTVTIKGDVKNDLPLIRRFVRTLNERGTLKIGYSAQKTIPAVCTDLVISDQGKTYKTFIVQFTADYPYFSDDAYNEKLLFMRNNLVRSPFKFPLILSKRENRSTILNIGDIQAEPIIEIHALTAPNPADPANPEITIQNITSGRQITLRRQLTVGELLTVDIPQRTVTSNIGGTILSALDDNSFLSDMILDKGENVLQVTNGSGGELSVICRHKNRYCQCII